MPICIDCERMQSSAEMRRSKKVEGGWVCKERERCKQLTRELRKERRQHESANTN